MTDGYVVVSPGRAPVRVDEEYEVMTRMLDSPGMLRFRRVGEQDWSSVALYDHDTHLPTGWRPAGRLFEVSARWGDNPATILVRRAIHP
jgi:hypothetical protein